MSNKSDTDFVSVIAGDCKNVDELKSKLEPLLTDVVLSVNVSKDMLLIVLKDSKHYLKINILHIDSNEGAEGTPNHTINSIQVNAFYLNTTPMGVYKYKDFNEIIKLISQIREQFQKEEKEKQYLEEQKKLIEEKEKKLAEDRQKMEKENERLKLKEEELKKSAEELKVKTNSTKKVLEERERQILAERHALEMDKMKKEREIKEFKERRQMVLRDCKSYWDKLSIPNYQRYVIKTIEYLQSNKSRLKNQNICWFHWGTNNKYIRINIPNSTDVIEIADYYHYYVVMLMSLGRGPDASKLYATYFSPNIRPYDNDSLLDMVIQVQKFHNNTDTLKEMHKGYTQQMFYVAPNSKTYQNPNLDEINNGYWGFFERLSSLKPAGASWCLDSVSKEDGITLKFNHANPCIREYKVVVTKKTERVFSAWEPSEKMEVKIYIGTSLFQTLDRICYHDKLAQTGLIEVLKRLEDN